MSHDRTPEGAPGADAWQAGPIAQAALSLADLTGAGDPDADVTPV